MTSYGLACSFSRHRIRFLRRVTSLYFHINEDMQCGINIDNGTDGMWFSPHSAHASHGVADMFRALGDLKEGSILPPEANKDIQWRAKPQAPLKVWRLFEQHLNDVFTGAATDPLRTTREFEWETEKQNRQIASWAARFEKDVSSMLTLSFLGGDSVDVPDEHFISQVVNGHFTALSALFPAGVLKEDEPISTEYKFSVVGGVNEPPEPAVLGDEMAVYKALVEHNSAEGSSTLLTRRRPP